MSNYYYINIKLPYVVMKNCLMREAEVIMEQIDDLSDPHMLLDKYALLSIINEKLDQLNED